MRPRVLSLLQTINYTANEPTQPVNEPATSESFGDDNAAIIGSVVWTTLMTSCSHPGVRIESHNASTGM